MRGLQNAASFATRAFGALGVTMSAGVFLAAADRMGQLSSRIEVATKAAGTFDATWSKLITSSAEVGASLETTIGTFEGLSNVCEVLGATDAQLVAITRAVAQLGTIGGATGERLTQGMQQFVEAIQRGRFQQEQLEQLTRTMPAVVNLLAKSFAGGRAELEKMVAEGRIFGRDVANLMLRQSARSRKPSRKFRPT